MKLSKEELEGSIFVLLFAISISFISWYTDYTLVIFKIITIPQWFLPIIALVLIIGWFVLLKMPEKYDENGNPLDKKSDINNDSN